MPDRWRGTLAMQDCALDSSLRLMCECHARLLAHSTHAVVQQPSWAAFRHRSIALHTFQARSMWPRVMRLHAHEFRYARFECDQLWCCTVLLQRSGAVRCVHTARALEVVTMKTKELAILVARAATGFALLVPCCMPTRSKLRSCCHKHCYPGYCD